MFSASQSRRELLLAGAAGAMTTLLGRNARAAEVRSEAAGAIPKAMASLPPVLKVSVAAYSFRKELDELGKPGRMSLFDLTDMAARWRIDAIEPTSYYFLKTDDEYLMQLKRKIFLAGLEISGTPARNNFCQKAGPALDESMDHIRKWVDYAVKLGSPAIRVFAGNNQAKLTRDESFKCAVEAFKQAAEYAAKKGVFLALENHGYMTETAADVIRILDAVDNEWFAANLDTGNFRDQPYEQMAQLAPRSVQCQIKAAVHEGGKAMPPDMNRIVRLLREAGYRGYVAIEYEGDDPHREVPVLLKQLQEAIRASA